MDSELVAECASALEEQYGSLVAPEGTNDKPYEVHMEFIAQAIIPIVLERAAKAVEKHRYEDDFLNSCGMRREHRGDLAQAIRSLMKDK